jgi:DNA-binding NtrC family response regulator
MMNKKNNEIVLLPADEINVLFLAGDIEFLDFFKSALDHRHMKISIAQNEIDCLNLLKSISIDVVVLDIKTPGVDALKMLQRIIKEFPHLDVILLTDHSSIREALNGIKLGAEAYLVKPTNLDGLVELIRKTFLMREEKLKNRNE